MRYVADLHIHSHFSRATSKDLNLEHLSKWAQYKGVQVVGTGDIAHPGWLAEVREGLEPAEDGLFRLKEDVARPIQAEMYPACRQEVRFLLAGEISNIYKKNGKVRKIHNVVFFPSFEALEKFQAKLETIGNIRSDGRPILGLDSRDLLEIVLETDPRGYFIPAHIWTPWFALFGSMSGFDSVEECFEDLTPHIFALETGLSSDPPMNWRLSALDSYTLVSNSDAHSPQKLAREANVFDTELSYPALFAALKSGDTSQFKGTIEFFPEEGKYHYDGHRKCDIRWTPETTLQHKGLCPVCGKKVTVGVMHRVASLADRPEGARPERTHPFQSLIPLPEVLGEVNGVGPTSKRVKTQYDSLLAKLGSELAILQDIPLAEIQKAGGELLAEGIRRMRAGELSIAAGFDGEYGTVKLFEDHERSSFSGQGALFSIPQKKKRSARSATGADSGTESAMPKPSEKTESGYQDGLFAPDGHAASRRDRKHEPEKSAAEVSAGLLSGLNAQQREAALCIEQPLCIVAGPGTGKTRTLTMRIAYLLLEKGVAPENVLAITFTNKAAEEMAERLQNLLGSELVGLLTIKTFHALCALILRERHESLGLPENFAICSPQEQLAVLHQAVPGLSEKEGAELLGRISEAKNQLLKPGSEAFTQHFVDDPDFGPAYTAYQAGLQASAMLDFDDLLLRTVELFEISAAVLQYYQARFRWISVDEYQDVNYAQYRLLRLLAGPECNLCVIGDPDQAIYGFRGARREYFLRFREDYPGARQLELQRNYRSVRTILDASGQLISPASKRNPGDIWSDIVSKRRVEVYQAPSHKAEAEYVVHSIEKLVGGTSYFSLDSGRVDSGSEGERSFGDFAVLFRLGAQGRELEEAFARSGIPYQLCGAKPLYEYRDIKDVLACLWFLFNKDSRPHLDIMLGPGRAGLSQQIQQMAARRDINLWQALQQYRSLGTLSATQASYLAELSEFLRELQSASADETSSGLLKRIRAFLDRRSPLASVPAEERFQRLCLRAAAYPRQPAVFLEACALSRETDEFDPRADRVALMTLHAAKGLEFPHVFIVGCEDGLMPYRLPGRECDIDEERRLLYVGMTRARENLVLTHAGKRFLFGQTQNNPVSPFLSDIEDALLDHRRAEARKPAPAPQEDQQLSLF